ncbi:outer membrane lipoprotein chaperone LolA [Pseudomonas neustonica]|uniref:Outer-membrane lipoprotein carrier protein n=1 Tax=Pseudomonas neustonica TaxID=2487346 RepID=A0ABX9XH43_9PSED|nr:outer membrane lipoprotein chaperone LolA [Pseudomonas sp. SSM44]ROZ84077.1 outer membrane lipoprotein chaperone LolA [Pseudomonas neustonica]|tara:strand:- start:140 stop:784 length:645 start_codon:yes stop_codon:yes gene_type:complete
MLKSLLRGPVLLLCACVLAMPTMAAGTDQESAAKRLNELLSAANTMSATFSQMTLSSNGSSLQETTGQVTLQRPGMFRWHTDAPLEQVLVSNGKKIWLYDPDLEQVTIQALDQRLTHTPALLLSGDVSTLSENFSISWQEGSTVDDFVLSPKASDTMFETLRLSFRDGVINDMQLNDPIGQRTNILFQGVKLNEPVDAGQFNFTIPEGVDVISE